MQQGGNFQECAIGKFSADKLFCAFENVQNVNGVQRAPKALLSSDPSFCECKRKSLLYEECTRLRVVEHRAKQLVL